MPCILLMQDGQTVEVACSVAEGKTKRERGGWQSFVTTEGNVCKVRSDKIDKVKPLRE